MMIILATVLGIDTDDLDDPANPPLTNAMEFLRHANSNVIWSFSFFKCSQDASILESTLALLYGTCGVHGLRLNRLHKAVCGTARDKGRDALIYCHRKREQVLRYA